MTPHCYNDTKEDIDKCLNCPYEDCIDCLSIDEEALKKVLDVKRREPKNKRQQAIWDLYKEGYCASDIAKERNMNVATVINNLIYMGLPTRLPMNDRESRKVLVASWKS